MLISIQGLILIAQPIYNEPGYEALKGTPEGKVQVHLSGIHYSQISNELENSKQLSLKDSWTFVRPFLFIQNFSCVLKDTV